MRLTAAARARDYVAVCRKPLPFPVYSCTIQRAKRAETVSNELTSPPVSGIWGGR